MDNQLYFVVGTSVLQTAVNSVIHSETEACQTDSSYGNRVSSEVSFPDASFGL